MCVIALVIALKADAQRSVLDEMAPQLVIKKTTMAEILKKERHVHKTRKQAVLNNNRTFSAFIVVIFYEDPGEGCDCLFIKNERTRQVYDVKGIFDTSGFPVKNLAWKDNQTLTFEAHRDDTDDIVRYAIDVRTMRLTEARLVHE
jgi:hypothetical protein